MLVWLVIGYLIGSVSPARIVGRRLTRARVDWGANGAVDTSSADWAYSGVSATAVLERFGSRWFALVAVSDGLKAFAPALIARLVFDDLNLALAVSIGVIVGHCYPVFHRFHGGRGQACTIGAFLAIDPLGVIGIVTVTVVVGLIVFTSVEVARTGYPLAALPWFLISDGPGPTVWFGLGVTLVTLLATLPDLRQEAAFRRQTGLAHLPWSQRFRVAWQDMFDPDPA